MYGALQCELSGVGAGPGSSDGGVLLYLSRAVLLFAL
jgi:hypothetical protein